MGRKKSSSGIFVAIAGVLVAIVGLGIVSKVASFGSNDKTNNKSDDKQTEAGTGNETTGDVYDTHIHEWELLFSTAATCSAVGYNEYECVCGETLTEELPMNEHTWSQYSEELEAATCTTGSLLRYTCEVCGTKKTVRQNDSLGHISVGTLATATCTEAGHTAGTYCSRCNTVLSGIEEMPALGHSLTEQVGTLAATCTKDGYLELKCSRCGKTERTTIPATGHTSSVLETVEATCLADGSLKLECSTCGAQWTETLPKLDVHPYDGGVCSTCGAIDLSRMSFVPSEGNYIGTALQSGNTVAYGWYKFSTDSALYFDAEHGIMYSASGLQYLRLDINAAGMVYYDITQATIPAGDDGIFVYIDKNLKYWTDDTHTAVASVWSAGTTALNVSGTISVLTEYSTHTHTYASGVCACGALEVDPFAELGETAEKTIADGELMVGNWYRVYRDSAILISDTGFFGLYCNTEGTENWGQESLIGYYSSELCYFVYDDYYDFYVISGTFKGLVINPDGSKYGTSFTIPAQAMVYSVNGTAYRLVMPCAHTYNDDGICTACGEVSSEYAANRVEADVAVGELVAGNWYRVYRGGCAVLDTPEQFAGIQANSGNDYPLGRNGNLIDRICPSLTYVVTEEYIDFYLAPGTHQTWFVSIGSTYSEGSDFAIDETTSITEIFGTVKRLDKAEA